MDLLQAAWMIRDIGQPVSAVHLRNDGSLIAGGWDGALREWNPDGDLKWSTICDDRIESILPVDDMVVVTSGLHLACLRDGEQLWSHALEGSADLLTLLDGVIIASSSVYDIEHGDFMESAIWRFSLEGELIEVERMDERPWFLDSEPSLMIGLGRPRCGIIIDGEHSDLATQSPVTCGLSGRTRTLIGHADGTISTHEGDLISSEESSVESLVCTEQGFVAALENGSLIARLPDASPLWSARGPQVTCQADGFDGTHWCGRFETVSGRVEVRADDGSSIASQETSRPRVATSTGDRVCFGFEDGQVMVWEKNLFERRSKDESSEVDERRDSLAAKLRALRG